jgi:hypothetical protein
MGWVEHVSRMGEKSDACKVHSENLKGRDHEEDLGVDGKMLKLILMKQCGRCELDSYG